MRRVNRLAATLATLALLVGWGVGLVRGSLLAPAGDEVPQVEAAILEYVTERNPRAPRQRFESFPEVLLAEAERTGLDHCLALAQAEVESDFRHDAVGGAGEVGIYQIMPATARAFRGEVGDFRLPRRRGRRRDLGDLDDPVLSTRIAMAYMRDLLNRRGTLREALTEYNGGPRYRHLGYFRRVMNAYARLLARPELGCRFERTLQKPPVTVALRPA